MNSIWTPGIKTPQLEESARLTTLERARSNGVIPEAIKAWERLQSRDTPLGTYVEELGKVVNSKVGHTNINVPPHVDTSGSLRGYWAQGLLKSAAGMALSAYREAGYVPAIDDGVVSTGSLFAEIGGIPDTYGVSSFDDPELVALVDTLSEEAGLRDSVVETNSQAVKTILYIGAGCTRHFLQQALAEDA